MFIMFIEDFGTTVEVIMVIIVLNPLQFVTK